MTQETKQTGHSDTTTEGIRVRVAAQFVPQQSEPERNHFVYAYRVVLTNRGERAAKLLSRHWVIRDANNVRRDVTGDGVIGEQPHLEPGERFEYMSGCPLSTEWGTMEGSYKMARDDGSTFEARIGRFFLAPSAAPIVAMDVDGD